MAARAAVAAPAATAATRASCGFSLPSGAGEPLSPVLSPALAIAEAPLHPPPGYALPTAPVARTPATGHLGQEAARAGRRGHQARPESATRKFTRTRAARTRAPGGGQGPRRRSAT